MSTALTTEHPFRDSVRLLQKLHDLIAASQDDSGEAEALRAEMDPLWQAMTDLERERIRGLSEDFYILAEGGAKQSRMSPEDRALWTEEASNVLTRMLAGQDVDAALRFLRKPIPEDQPRSVVSFMQARCWERLGEGDLALRFLREAERLDPHQAVCVLILLQKLGRKEEAAEYAQRVIDNKDSTSEELYQAAGALFWQARRIEALKVRPFLQKIATVLERALRVFFTTPKEKREIPFADQFILAMLGFVYQQLGNRQAALALYNEGLARYPNIASLLTLRGLAQIEIDLPLALTDFRKAVQAGALSMWPYYFLAGDALQNQNYLQAWELSLRAIDLYERLVQPEGKESLVRQLAQLHEWLGIAMTELGQPKDRILDSFRKAESLDPDNQRIQHNRRVAEAPMRTGKGSPGNGWRIDGSVTSKLVSRTEFLEEQRAPDLFVERADASLLTLAHRS